MELGYHVTLIMDATAAFSQEGMHAAHKVKVAAWATILPLLTSGTVKPIVERTYKLEDAAEALRHLIEDRSFGQSRVGWLAAVG